MSAPLLRWFSAPLILVALSLASSTAWAYADDCTHFVDLQLGSDCAGNYSIAARDCSGSDGHGYTAAHLQDALDALGPGDTLCLREGLYELPPFEVRCNGTETEPIVVGSYADEAVRLRRTSSSSGTFVEVSGSHVTLGGFTLSTWDEQDGGCCVWQKAPGHHVTYDEMTFEECGDSGVTIHGLYADGFTHDITIQNSHFQSIGQDTADEAIGWTAEAYNLHVHHNSFDDVIDALVVDFGDNTIIFEHNVVTNVRGENAVDTKQTYPVYEGEPGRWTDGYAHIRYNDFGSTTATGGPPGSAISGLIHTGNNSRYIRIYGNYFHHHSMDGIWMNARATSDTRCDHGDVAHIYIYNNIFDTLGNVGISFGSNQDVTVDCDPPHEYRDIHVYNNTFIDGGADANHFYGSGIYYHKTCNEHSHDIYIKNNLLVGNNPSNTPHVQLSAGSAQHIECPGLFIDHNLYFYEGETQLFRVDTAYETLAEWQANHGHDANGLSADPLLELSGERPLPYARLQLASPAIDGGEDLSAFFTDDFEGQPREPGAWDIGADEYGVAEGGGGGDGGGSVGGSGQGGEAGGSVGGAGGATSPAAAPGEDSGCGCTAAGERRRSWSLAWLLVAGLWIPSRRRRERGSRSRTKRAWAVAAALAAVSFSAVASAETYYLRDDGAAEQVAAAQSSGGACDSAATAMSVATHNAGSFEPGDTIYVCGAITSDVTIRPPSSGEQGSPITYRGDDATHPGSLEQSLRANIGSQIHVRNRHDLAIRELDFRSDVTGDDPHPSSRSGIWIDAYEEGNTTSGIEVDRCTFYQTITGIIILSRVSHVTVTRCTFRDLVNNGLGVTSWPGDSANHPSYLTVGGSPDAGNTFINVTRMNPDEDVPGGVPGQAIGTRVDDLVFSYNHVYAEDPGWGAGVYLNGVERVLIEHNTMHDLDSGRRRPTITVKSDIGWHNGDIIIRSNRVGPSHGGRTYITPDVGISVGNCVDRAVIYGNYVTDVVGMGIASNWGWHPNVAADDCGVEDLFIFSNVIDRTQTASGIYLAGCSSVDGVACTDGMTNVHVVNNTVFRPVDAYDEQFASNTGIMAHCGGDHYESIAVVNNIVDTPRDDTDDYVGLHIREQDDLSVDFNHHYFPGQTPAVYFDGSDCVPCAWDSADRPTGYGEHDTEGDPGYVDAEQGDFALREESPCRDTGQPLEAQIPTITIQGVEYDVALSEGLDPRLTDWQAIPPVVHYLDQNQHGSGWERGAYVYPDSEKCEFLSGIPCADGEYCEGGELVTAEDAELCCVGGSCQAMTCANQGYACCPACQGEPLALDGCDGQLCCAACLGDPAASSPASQEDDAGGCGCRTPGSAPSGVVPLGLLAGLVMLVHCRSGRHRPRG